MIILIAVEKAGIISQFCGYNHIMGYECKKYGSVQIVPKRRNAAPVTIANPLCVFRNKRRLFLLIVIPGLGHIQIVTVDKEGGIAEDKSCLFLYREDILPEEGKYYVFLTRGGRNGDIYTASGMNTTVLLDMKAQ